jgi:hypothetical protein
VSVRRTLRLTASSTFVGPDRASAGVVQAQDIGLLRIPPSSMTFTLLLGFLVALPSFGIDMSLPAAHGHR